MRNKILPATAVAFGLGFSLCSPPSGAAELSEPVRLPSIFRKWGTETAGIDLPETTIAELGRCMGRDQQLSRDVRDLKATGAQLERDSEVLKATFETMAAARDRLRIEQEALLADSKALEERNAAIEKSRTRIEARSRKGVRDQAETKRLQADIDAFNREVVAYNDAVRTLQARSREADGRVNEYNGKSAAVQAEADPVMQRAMRYEAQLAEFEKLLERYKAKCLGERKIVY